MSSCGCGQNLWGGMCCGGAQSGNVITPATVLAGGVDASALGIFNPLHYGMAGGAPQAQNANGLAATFSAVAVAQAGWIWVPGFNFQLTVPSGGQGYNVPDQTVIQGFGSVVGNNAATTQFSIQSTSGIFLNFSGPHSSGGQTVSDVAISYPAGASLGSPGAPVSIGGYAKGAWNARFFRVNFFDVPTAAYWDSHSLSCGLMQCTIQNPNVSNATQTPAACNPWVSFNGAQQYTVGPGEYFQNKTSGNSGPQGQCVISLNAPSEHTIMAWQHYSNTDFGINSGCTGGGGNLRFAHILGIESENFLNCLWLQPPGSGGQIYGFRSIGNIWKASPSSTSSYPNAYLDANGGTIANIDDFIEIGALTYQGANDGWSIGKAQNWILADSAYRGNGTGSAGVAITGPSGNGKITNCNLTPLYPNAQNSTQAQLYAFRIAANAGVVGIIQILGCDMTGYSGGTCVSIGASAFSGGKLYINLCPGYNDFDAAVYTGSMSSAQSASAQGFYGPSQIEWYGGSGYTRTRFGGASFTSTATTGQLLLGPYDTLSISGSPTYSWRRVWG